MGLFQSVRDFIFKEILSSLAGKILSPLLLAGLLYVFPQTRQPLADVFNYFAKLLNQLPSTPVGGTPPMPDPNPKPIPMPEPRRIHVPITEAGRMVLCPHLTLRRDHTRTSNIVAVVKYGDLIELIHEWGGASNDLAVALSEIDLMTSDSISIPIEVGDSLKILFEDASQYEVETLRGNYVGAVAKDLVERLDAWMRVRTVACDSGWVLSDSIDSFTAEPALAQ